MFIKYSFYIFEKGDHYKNPPAVKLQRTTDYGSPASADTSIAHVLHSMLRKYSEMTQKAYRNERPRVTLHILCSLLLCHTPGLHV